MKPYGPTTQCNSKTLDYVKCSRCPPLVIIHAIGLNHHQWLLVDWETIVCQSTSSCLS